jgi:hypothetical protein
MALTRSRQHAGVGTAPARVALSDRALTQAACELVVRCWRTPSIHDHDGACISCPCRCSGLPSVTSTGT